MIKKLSKSIREYKKASILTSVFMLLELTMTVLLPFFMANLIDNGIEGGDMSYIVKMGLFLLVLALLSLTFGYLNGIFAADASTGFAANLRYDMMSNIQRYSFSNIDRFSTASLVTRLTTDVSNVQNAFQMIIRQAVRAPLMIIFALIMSFNVNRQISLIFLALVPALALGLYVIIRYAHPIFVRGIKKYDKLNSVVQENLHGIRVVKSFVREEKEKSKFGETSTEIYKDFSKAQKGVAFNAPLIQFCVYTSMILIAWIGAKFIVSGSMTTGQLTSIIAYSMQILMNLTLLSIVFVVVIISKASAERIVEVLDEKSDIKSKEDALTVVKDGSITFKGVGFSYVNDSEKLCLSQIDLEIKSGETVGIIGGTGSSKTSLVQLIPRLYDVTEGSVLVGGEDVRDYDIESLRSQIGVVLQKNLLFSGTIKENLRWGKEDATDEEIIRACRLAQADEFITSFDDGYDTYIEQGGRNVSGGQRQRLCIARALIKTPKILILDDSTSAVDTKTDALIRKAFKEYIPDTTKIIISQRISSVQDADKILVMDGGKISGIGTHRQLLKTNSIYREVHNSQMQGGDFDE